MADPMDISLDEIISRKRSSRGGGGGGNRSRQRTDSSYSSDNGSPRTARRNDNNNGRRNRYSDKPYSRSTGNANGTWRHDMFEGGPRDLADRIGSRRTVNEPSGGSTQIRVENLHWNVSEQDISELMGAYGTLRSVKLKYDNAGRSEGVCTVTFDSEDAAVAAIEAYDGRDLDGMKMTATLVRGSSSRHGGGGGGGGAITNRLGPKVGNVLDRLGKKLEDRLGPRMQNNIRNGHTTSGGGGGGGGRRQPRVRAVAEDLDAQMDRYMAGEAEPEPEVTPSYGGANRRVVVVDWDKPVDVTQREVITYDDINPALS
ncbi:hypothetical protein DFJ77DRAFT_470681 [Powellomyces hirtus]|nr:hypothetical protein DFJ77DRAFT_470681 [Powellomyces hirtus]